MAAAAGAAREAELAAASDMQAGGALDITAEEDNGTEDISMEEVLGTGTRKQPAAAKASAEADDAGRDHRQFLAVRSLRRIPRTTSIALRNSDPRGSSGAGQSL